MLFCVKQGSTMKCKHATMALSPREHVEQSLLKKNKTPAEVELAGMVTQLREEQQQQTIQVAAKQPRINYCKVAQPMPLLPHLWKHGIAPAIYPSI